MEHVWILCKLNNVLYCNTWMCSTVVVGRIPCRNLMYCWVLFVMSSWCYIFDMLLLLLNELINSISIKFIHKQRSYHKHNFNLHTRYIKITALRHLFCPLIYNVHILHTITSSLSWHRKTFTLVYRQSQAQALPPQPYILCFYHEHCMLYTAYPRKSLHISHA